ncbi:hypothetical protein C8Q76DRAFT_571154, partial [Earliella scabrosa]
LDLDYLGGVAGSCELGSHYIAYIIGERVRRHLRPIFPDLRAFAQEMYDTGSVLGGETALHLLYPSIPPPPTVHIFTPHMAWSHVVSHIIDVQRCGQPLLTTCAIWRVRGNLGLARFKHTGSNIPFLRVEQSRCNTPLEPIARLWNSALASYISATTYCVAYPDLIPRQRALVPSHHLDQRGTQFGQRIRSLVERWQGRGWDIACSPEAWTNLPLCGHVPTPYCPSSTRWFGDEHCVVGYLHPLRAIPAPRPLRLALEDRYVIVWWRGGRRCSQNC